MPFIDALVEFCFYLYRKVIITMMIHKVKKSVKEEDLARLDKVLSKWVEKGWFAPKTFGVKTAKPRKSARLSYIQQSFFEVAGIRE